MSGAGGQHHGCEQMPARHAVARLRALSLICSDRASTQCLRSRSRELRSLSRDTNGLQAPPMHPREPLSCVCAASIQHDASQRCSGLLWMKRLMWLRWHVLQEGHWPRVVCASAIFHVCTTESCGVEFMSRVSVVRTVQDARDCLRNVTYDLPSPIVSPPLIMPDWVYPQPVWQVGGGW